MIYIFTLIPLTTSVLIYWHHSIRTPTIQGWHINEKETETILFLSLFHIIHPQSLYHNAGIKKYLDPDIISSIQQLLYVLICQILLRNPCVSRIHNRFISHRKSSSCRRYDRCIPHPKWILHNQRIYPAFSQSL